MHRFLAPVVSDVAKIRRFGSWFLFAQAIGAILWWCMLIGWPESRALFQASSAPDSVLLAFAAADGILFIGAGALAGYGIRKGRRWAFPVLCMHGGAAAYGALYCWMLVALTGGDGLLGAVLMSPSLVVPAILVWSLWPEDTT